MQIMHSARAFIVDAASAQAKAENANRVFRLCFSNAEAGKEKKTVPKLLHGNCANDDMFQDEKKKQQLKIIRQQPI